MRPLVSIIVPVFNVEPYIRRCLDSLESQTYSSIEVIIVDDGSQDKSADIAEDYCRRDSRFTLISQENKGQGNARNTGITAATGEYITFVDSDDYVSTYYIERMIELAALHDADIVSVNLIKFFDRQIPDKDNTPPKIVSFNGTDAVADMWYGKHLSNSAWAKVYHRQILKDIPFPEGVLYEDLGVIYKWMHRAGKVVWTSEKLYYYYQRSNGTMNGAFSRKKLDRIIVSRELLDWAEKQCPELQQAAEARFFLSNIQVLREIPCSSEYQNEINEIRNSIKKYRNRVIKNRRVKPVNRMIAAFSLLDIRILKGLGVLYKAVWK